jgi:hypothetical protein
MSEKPIASAFEEMWTRVGIISPKRVDNLRPEVVPLVGRTFEFDYVGIGDIDEPYPGQSRWTPARKYDAELGKDAAGYWFPDEDISIAADASRGARHQGAPSAAASARPVVTHGCDVRPHQPDGHCCPAILPIA